MIKSIKLQNFRAFQGEVEVRVRPITVLIGRNSAGKSSLIKFLLMVKQTLASQADTFFATEGDEVHLGTWADLRHSSTRFEPFRDKYLKYSIDIETDDLPPPEVQQMWNITSKNAAVIRNSAGVKWSSKLLNNQYGKRILKDVSRSMGGYLMDRGWLPVVTR